MGRQETLTISKRVVSGVAVIGGLLTLESCGDDNEAPNTSTPSAARSTSAEAQSSTATTESAKSERMEMVFDDLGARSPIIRVYQGPGESDADKEVVGRYNDGDVVEAECKTTGRTVESVPPEPPVESDQWIRFKYTGDIGWYATAVYVEEPEQLLSQLKEC